MYEVCQHVMCDSACPIQADAGLLFGETVQIAELADLWRSGKIRKVAISRFGGEISGEFVVSGWKTWRHRLLDRGVEDEHIVTYPLSTKLPPCTDAEAIGFVDFAKERGWKTVYVVVPELHRFRSFISLVSAAAKAGYELKVWSYPMPAQDYSENVFFTQSAPKGPRKQFIPVDLNKTFAYCKKGDYLTSREILDYFDWRDEK